MVRDVTPNSGDTGPATKIVAAIARWNYERSVEKLLPKISKWNYLTVEIVKELYIAREVLKKQTGQRKDPDADDYISYTWAGYCDDIGVSRQTANGWLRRFIPAELSDKGEDTLLSPEEMKALEPPELPLTTRDQERRIAQVMATGERPGDWSKTDERILRQRLSDKKAKEIDAVWLEGKFGRPVRRDYFSDVRAITGKTKRFKLKTESQINAQITMFRAIHEYLGVFPDMESLMAAAINLTDKIHTAANYLAELLAVPEAGDPQE
jgi:hypothetical protein